MRRRHYLTKAVHKKNITTAFSIFMKHETDEKIYVVRRNKKTFIFFDDEEIQDLFECSNLVARNTYEFYDCYDFDEVLPEHYDTLKNPTNKRSIEHWFSNWIVLVTDKKFTVKEKKFINLLESINKYGDTWNLKQAMETVLDNCPPKYIPMLFNVR